MSHDHRILAVFVVWFLLVFAAFAEHKTDFSMSDKTEVSPDAWQKIRHQMRYAEDLTFYQKKKLVAADADAEDEFGASIAVDGDLVVVGAPFDSAAGSDAGAVYVFARNQGGADQWGQVKKIVSSDIASQDFFGNSVATHGDVIVVGADGNDDAGSNSGSAYVFERNQGGLNNWGQVKKLTASDAQMLDSFGWSVDVYADRIAVGAIWAFGTAVYQGAAYIFERNQGGANNWGEVKILTAFDGAASDHFGNSIALNGDTVVVGAYGDDDNGTDSGSAYVFSRDQGGSASWGLQKKVTTTGGQAGDEFGHTVDLAFGTMVVGAPGESTLGSHAGAAYIFGLDQGGQNNWGQVKKLMASDGDDMDSFGESVSISDSQIVVGAPWEDSVAGLSGAAYVFQRNSGGSDFWGQSQKLKSSDAAYSDHFGSAVAVFADMVAAGAPGVDGVGSDCGAAYFFRQKLNSWAEETKISGTSVGASDGCGWAIAAHGDRVVVGAPGDDDNGNSSGAVYLFARNQGGADMWGQVKKLTASDASADSHFGQAVDIWGDRIAVGALYEDTAGTDAGAVYVFDRNRGGADNWGEMAKLTSSDIAADDRFGTSVAVFGDIVLAGSPLHDGTGTDSGAAYFFDVFYFAGGVMWIEFKKIVPADAAAGDGFGYAVDRYVDVVVVSAPLDDGTYTDSGSAYVFRQNQGGADNWGLLKKITAADAEGGDEFGASVGVFGPNIAVGSPGESQQGHHAGAAYLFRRNQGGVDAWGQVSKVVASDAAANAVFGMAISLHGDVLAVGAYGADSLTGSAYLFERNGAGADVWAETQTITASDGATLDIFGTSIALNAHTLFVGSPYADHLGTQSGSAYIFSPTCLSPNQPGAISGPGLVCAGDASQAYSITPVTGATTYTWTLPSGCIITSGHGTASILVDWSTTSGSVTVTAGNTCGTSTASTLPVTVEDVPPQPSPISGPSDVCQMQTGVSYSVTVYPTALQYNWTVPSGAMVTSGQGTASIVVEFGLNSGPVTVTPENDCGFGTIRQKSVDVHPPPTVGIFGPIEACNSESVPLEATPGLSAYLWSTGDSTQSIWVSNTVTEMYSVTAENAFGCENTAFHEVTIVTRPLVCTVNSATPSACAVSTPVEITARAECGTPGTLLYAYHWSILNGPPGGGHFDDPNAQVVDFTPLDFGLYELQVIAEDPGGGTQAAAVALIMPDLDVAPPAGIDVDDWGFAISHWQEDASVFPDLDFDQSGNLDILDLGLVTHCFP